jgi:hypothetical protein
MRIKPPAAPQSRSSPLRRGSKIIQITNEYRNYIGSDLGKYYELLQNLMKCNSQIQD